MLLYRAYVAAIFFPCHPYIWSTTVLHDNYNGPVMLAWQANMDLLYVLNACACIMYVDSYHEDRQSHGELLKRAAY